MCMILYKPKKEKMPNDSILEQCFINNSDGAGFMIVARKKLWITKGYMTIDKLLKALNPLKDTDKAIVIHFRRSTSAKVSAEFTHPYPITSDLQTLKATLWGGKLAACHNGVISHGLPHMTDTMEFIVDRLVPLQQDIPDFYKSDSLMGLVEDASNSKWAFMDSEGYVRLVGKFEEVEGIFYSNDSYKKRTIIDWEKMFDSSIYSVGSYYSTKNDKSYKYYDKYDMD